MQVADNGAPSLNDTQAVRITVNEVNDAPIFTGGPSQVVDEDAGVQTVTGWATNIIPGTADEATQALTFHVSASHAALFASQPAIVAATGALTYTPAANIHGAAAITVTLQDNGGAANGGVDTSAAYFFTITVNAVNDAPVVGDITRQGYAGSLVAFSLADFLAVFSDLEGDALARVRITTLPISGTLRLDGVPVTAGQELTATEAVIGGLTFTPAANAKGQASFGWNGSDGLAYAAADGLVTVSILGSRTRLPILIR